MTFGFRSALLGSLIALAIGSNAFAQAEDYLRQAEEAVSRGDDPAAIQLYQSAIIYAPATIAPYIGIAEYFADNNRLDSAEIYFGIALEMEPAQPSALKGLGLLALEHGDVEGAEARHDILMEACAPACPEAAELRNAINTYSPSAVTVD